MGLYNGNAPVESGNGSKVEAGAYIFKVEEGKHYPNNNSVGMRLKLWDNDNTVVSEKFWVFLNIDSSAKEALRQETDRRLTVLLGKPALESVDQLIGRVGYVVVRAGEKNGEIIPFGGMFTSERKSANGNETMADRIKEAMEYDWTKDTYAVSRSQKAAPSTPETSGDEPF
jgi:hypothetical protein